MIQFKHLLYFILSMSLFVGNVSKKVTPRQFQEQFKFFGRCKVDLRKRFAFVQYQNQRNAEEAKKQLQNRNFCGLRLNIEWSKNSGRFNENSKNNNGRKRSRSRDRSWRRDDRWYRRSPSYEKRSSPTFSDHENLQEFEPKCERDKELLRRIQEKKEQKRLRQLQRQKEMQVEERMEQKINQEVIEDQKEKQQIR